MTEMTTRVAKALEQAFKDRVSENTKLFNVDGTATPFEATGVTAPGFDVWEAYAEAAIGVCSSAIMQRMHEAKAVSFDRAPEMESLARGVENGLNKAALLLRGVDV